MKKLGKSQQAVYDFIRQYIKENSIPPTVREICAAVGLKSTSTVHMHLKNLAQMGLIRQNPSMQRSITLCEPLEQRGATPACRELPLVGAVAAGTPILAVENIQEMIPLPSALLHGAKADEAFVLRIRGDSMIDAGIHNGDLIIVHSGLKAENGDIVVARVGEDTATVKRVFFEQDRIRLQPENASMEPIYANYADVVIAGKVISLLRRY